MAALRYKKVCCSRDPLHDEGREDVPTMPPNEWTLKIQRESARTDRQKYSLIEAGCALPKNIEANIPNLIILLYQELSKTPSNVIFHQR